MTVVYVAIAVISVVMLFAQVQLFSIKNILEEIRDKR